MAAPLLEAEAPPATRSGGTRGFGEPPDEARDGGSGGAGLDPARLGLWAFLGTVTMLFIGFTSAYIVRRTGADWRPLPLPSLLWINTGVLLLSSAALEVSRRRRNALDLRGLRVWLGATALLASLFVAGQFQAWRLLRALGFFLSSNPHSSFFYMLSGVHLLHLAGGLVWFSLVLFRLRGARYAAPGGGRVLSLFATYWHFLGLLWVYVLVLIFFF